jgi:hypothetical protein
VILPLSSFNVAVSTPVSLTKQRHDYDLREEAKRHSPPLSGAFHRIKGNQACARRLLRTGDSGQVNFNRFQNIAWTRPSARWQTEAVLATRERNSCKVNAKKWVERKQPDVSTLLRR